MTLIAVFTVACSFQAVRAVTYIALLESAAITEVVEVSVIAAAFRPEKR